MIIRRLSTPYSFEPPTDGLRQRATAGIAKTGLSQGVRLLVQFASVVVLSRLLPPREFGLVAMVSPVVAFAALFQDLGLSQALVQKQVLTQQEVSGLFWINVVVSVSLALVLLALSPLVAFFYGEPRVAPLTAVMGASLVCGGLGALQYALLNRQMKFGILAFIDAASAVTTLLVSVIFALLTSSVWALIVGSLAGVVVTNLGYWLASEWLPSWPSLRAEVRHVLRFGANVTGFNIANFFARNFDNVLIGRAWGEDSLGLYDRAYKLLLMPLQQINNPISKVMLPVLSQLAQQPDRYKLAYFRVMAQILLIAMPGIAFLIGASPLLIPFLLGDKWVASIPIFGVLGFVSFVQVVNNTAGWLLVSQNRSKDYMYWGVFNSVTCILSFFAGLPFGPFGVALAYTAGEYLRTPLLWVFVTRRGAIRLSDMIDLSLPHVIGALASLCAVKLVCLSLGTEKIFALSVALVSSYLISVAVLAAFRQGRETMRQALQIARNSFAKVSSALGYAYSRH